MSPLFFTPVFAMPLSVLPSLSLEKLSFAGISLEKLSTVNWQAIYLVGMLITALVIGYHALISKRYDGKTPDTAFFAFASIHEGVWLLLSGIALYYAHFLPMIKAVPMAYIIYSLFGWCYGFYLLKDEVTGLESVDDITMPLPYLDYCLAFSWTIFPISLAMLYGLWQYGFIVLP